jgi:hypothetical protein
MRILDATSPLTVNTSQLMAIVSKQKNVLLSNQGCMEQIFQNDCHEKKTKVQLFMLQCKVRI